MGDKLTTEQLALLENLTYMAKGKPTLDGEKLEEGPLLDIEGYEGKTVGDWLDDVRKNAQTHPLIEDADYGSYMTGRDWNDIITAVNNDPQLRNLEIKTTHVDEAGGGKSAVFIDSTTNEAIVAFRGTAEKEWKDNFIGGGPVDTEKNPTNKYADTSINPTNDEVSTRDQKAALDWYGQLDLDDYYVTTIGHSKGGNKAKYITIMDDSIDRCVSFDGQGFSDEFYNKYNDAILKNQDKISNNNTNSDYVNLLLNDVGDTKFYQGYDYGKGGFLENHCPNTYLNFKDNPPSMKEAKRDDRMKVIDEYLNSYLRTLSPEDKKATLDMLGQAVEDGFAGKPIEGILRNLTGPENREQTANLLAYTRVYNSQHPEFRDSVLSIAQEATGLPGVVGQAGKIVDALSTTHPLLKPGISFGVDAVREGFEHLPEGVQQTAVDYINKKCGTNFTINDTENIINTLHVMEAKEDEVKLNTTGQDLKATVEGPKQKEGFIDKIKNGISTIKDCDQLELLISWIKAMKMLEGKVSVETSSRVVDLGAYALPLIAFKIKIDKELKSSKMFKNRAGVSGKNGHINHDPSRNMQSKEINLNPTKMQETIVKTTVNNNDYITNTTTRVLEHPSMQGHVGNEALLAKNAVGLEALGLNAANLVNIDAANLDAILSQLGITADGMQAEELKEAMQKLDPKELAKLQVPGRNAEEKLQNMLIRMQAGTLTIAELAVITNQLITIATSTESLRNNVIKTLEVVQGKLQGIVTKDMTNAMLNQAQKVSRQDKLNQLNKNQGSQDKQNEANKNQEGQGKQNETDKSNSQDNKNQDNKQNTDNSEKLSNSQEHKDNDNQQYNEGNRDNQNQDNQKYNEGNQENKNDKQPDIDNSQNDKPNNNESYNNNNQNNEGNQKDQESNTDFNNNNETTTSQQPVEQDKSYDNPSVESSVGDKEQSVESSMPNQSETQSQDGVSTPSEKDGAVQEGSEIDSQTGTPEQTTPETPPKATSSEKDTASKETPQQPTEKTTEQSKPDATPTQDSQTPESPSSSEASKDTQSNPDKSSSTTQTMDDYKDKMPDKPQDGNSSEEKKTRTKVTAEQDR